ncbi:GHKL domain-containing protein [Halobacteriovorax sp. HLS]|uniref:GHKL domain-containing protein n=1 Tax=Halobacteriovorax sp. HLS TaxID=2234000 RepID=UPI000FD74411|nr:GHKL domain-containing protein [Halobacteriovorax sp. HLS]
MNYFRRDLQRTFKLIDLYLVQSFFVSLALWIGLHYRGLDQGIEFFSSCLLAVHYLFFTNAAGQLEKVAWSWHLPILFVFQIASFMGLAHNLGLNGPLFVSVMPCVAGMYYFLYQDGRTPERGERKSWALMAIGMSLFIISQTVSSSHSLSIQEGMFLAIFTIWSLTTVFFGNEFFLTERKNLFKRIKSGHQEFQESFANKERYFFHDIINQTHGINLFLSSKISDGVGISALDTTRIHSEVKLLQSLIKDHFGYGHKDLQDSYEYVKFDFAKMGLFNLVENFLDADDIVCHFVFKGDIASDISFESRNRALVHYPTFYRVLNNLIKNISEQNSKLIEFTFSYEEDGLHVNIKNKILSLKDNRDEVEKDLSKIILESNVLEFKERGSGVGLESISSLIQHIDGEFRFSIEGEFWVSEIYFPRPNGESKSIAI